MTPADTRSVNGRNHTVRMVVYLLLAVAGLVGTWYFNLRFDGAGGQNYLQAWFDNAASSSVAVDVIVTAVAACAFYLVEGRRLGIRWAWLLIPATFLLALAFTFPLFLALRERALLRIAAGAPDHVLANG